MSNNIRGGWWVFLFFTFSMEYSIGLEADLLIAMICFDVGFQFMEPRPGRTQKACQPARIRFSFGNQLEVARPMHMDDWYWFFSRLTFVLLRLPLGSLLVIFNGLFILLAALSIEAR